MLGVAGEGLKRHERKGGERWKTVRRHHFLETAITGEGHGVQRNVLFC